MELPSPSFTYGQCNLVGDFIRKFNNSTITCNDNGGTYRTCFDETFAIGRVFSDNKIKVIIVLNTADITNHMQQSTDGCIIVSKLINK